MEKFAKILCPADLCILSAISCQLSINGFTSLDFAKKWGMVLQGVGEGMCFPKTICSETLFLLLFLLGLV